MSLLTFHEAIAMADADETRWGPETDYDDPTPDQRAAGPPSACLPAEERGAPRAVEADNADDDIVVYAFDIFRALPTVNRPPVPGGMVLDLAPLRSLLNRHPESLESSGSRFPKAAMRRSLAAEFPENTSPEEILRERSSVDPSTVTPADFFDMNYLAGDQLALANGPADPGIIYVVGESGGEDIRPGEDGLFFCPNTVDGVPRPDIYRSGASTLHCPENIRECRFGAFSLRAERPVALRTILRLPLPIVSVTCNGGGKLHVLVRLSEWTRQEGESQLSSLNALLRRLGAESWSLRSSCLVRVPNVPRGDRMQALLYFNPVPACRPILPFDGE